MFCDTHRQIQDESSKLSGYINQVILNKIIPTNVGLIPISKGFKAVLKKDEDKNNASKVKFL
jgi:cadmium resistance protein CadD (predicted permease)